MVQKNLATGKIAPVESKQSMVAKQTSFKTLSLQDFKKWWEKAYKANPQRTITEFASETQSMGYKIEGYDEAIRKKATAQYEFDKQAEEVRQANILEAKKNAKRSTIEKGAIKPRFANLVGGATAEVPSFVWNQLSFASNVIKGAGKPFDRLDKKVFGMDSNSDLPAWEVFNRLDKSVFGMDTETPKQVDIIRNIDQWFREVWQDGKEWIQEILDVNPDAWDTKVWEFGTQMVGSLYGTPRAPIALKNIPVMLTSWIVDEIRFSAGRGEDLSLLRMLVSWALEVVVPASIKWVVKWAKRWRKMKLDQVDEFTKTAMKEGNITVVEAKKMADIAEQSVSTTEWASIKNPDTFTYLADQIGEVVDMYINKPLKQVWKNIWEIKKTIRGAGKDLPIDTRPALDAFDDMLDKLYNVKIVDWEIVPVAWNVGMLEWGEKTLLLDLQKKLSRADQWADITNIFDSLNKQYDDMMAQTLTGKKNKQMLSYIHRVREALEEQLDNLIWPEYKKVRMMYSDLKDKKEALDFLRQRNVPWIDAEYTTSARIKKLFSPDRWQVMDQFKQLEEITGVDFMSRAQVAKFYAEQFGDRKALSLLDPAFLDNPSTLWALTRWWRWAKNKVVGTPLENAEMFVKQLDNVPQDKLPEIVWWVEDIINKVNATAYKTQQEAQAELMRQVKALPFFQENPTYVTPWGRAGRTADIADDLLGYEDRLWTIKEVFSTATDEELKANGFTATMIKQFRKKNPLP